MLCKNILFGNIFFIFSINLLCRNMEEPENSSRGKKARNFAKYTGIAFQMLATIGVFAFIGYQIDQHRNGKKPIFMALLGLIGVVFSLYQVVQSVTKDK